MSQPTRIPDESALDEAAAEWLWERENGWTAERERAFAAWCAQDVRHAAAVSRVEQTLKLLDQLPLVHSRLERRLETGRAGSGTAAAPVRGSQWVWIGGLAAAVAVGIAMWQWSESSPAPPTEHYATDDFVQRSLALADGSVMDINIDSEVAVQFTTRERRVTLEKGEAYFQVAPEPGRPFIVTAGNIAVRAVGTAFEVRLTSEAVDVVVVEGKVELGRSVVEPASPARASPPLLQAGQRAQMERNASAVAASIETVDVSAMQSWPTWITPMTSFTDVPLRDVIARFNRRNTTQMILDDPELGERKIGGKIALDQVDAFVRLLEQDGEVVADRTRTGRIELRRAR